MEIAVEKLKKEVVDIHNFLFPENKLESFNLSLIGKGKGSSEYSMLTYFAFRLEGFMASNPSSTDLENITKEIALFNEDIRKKTNGEN